MNPSFVFPFLSFPIFLVSRPELLNTICILFLASNLLLGGFQPLLHFRIRINSLIKFPGEFGEGRRGTSFQ
jgi:hypothetical protein